MELLSPNEGAEELSVHLQCDLFSCFTRLFRNIFTFCLASGRVADCLVLEQRYFSTDQAPILQSRQKRSYGVVERKQIESKAVYTLILSMLLRLVLRTSIDTEQTVRMQAEGLLNRLWQ